MKYTTTLLALATFTLTAHAQSTERVYLWPSEVPNETLPKAEPTLAEDQSGRIIRLTNVTNPAFTVYSPSNRVHNGVGIIVCPGGGYGILAMDLEGTEVAEWLTDLGYTAFVLEYRVPNNREGALNDAQRAIRIIRSRVKDWDINTSEIGVIGFSAGGNLAVKLSTLYNEESYPSVDTIDALSSRPDFTLLIYPGGLDDGPNRTLTPGLPVDENTPPTFVFGAANDRLANDFLVITQALRDANVPVELHLLPQGGHGYGLRKGNPAAEAWPTLAEKWLDQVINN